MGEPKGAYVETHDGGSLWNMQMDTTTSWFIGCSFIDSNTGYAAANGGQIYKTTNGGTTWNLVYYSSVPLYAVFFVNHDTGFASGIYEILKTTNAGASWSSYSISNSLTRLFFTNANQGYCIGFSGGILKTMNCGGYWAPQTSGVSVNLNCIYFIDTATGWIVGDGGTILKTTNGGTTWTALTSGITTSLSGVWFIDSNIGYVVGAGGKILKTTDGGMTWNPEASGTTADLYRVVFPNSSTGYAVGGSGTILKTVCGTSPVASFTDSGTHIVSFVYTGTGSMDSVRWSFGDGFTSTAMNPTHTYTANGTYTVCVVNYNSCGNDTACRSVVVSTVGIGNLQKIENSVVNIYPNPTKGECTIDGANGGELIIYDVVGQIVTNIHIFSDNEVFNINQLPKGLYIANITKADGCKVIYRIMKE